MATFDDVRPIPDLTDAEAEAFIRATTGGDPVIRTVEPVITPRRAIVAAAVLAAIILAFVVGLALGGGGPTGIDPADCVNPPGPGLWCPAP
jgi:hypothetical protein